MTLTIAPSDLASYLADGLRDIAPIEDLGDGLRVTTQCMYPSNGLVQVIVRGGGRFLTISDDGGAVDEAESAGIDLRGRGSDGVLLRVVEPQGLRVQQGVIFAGPTPVEDAATSILLVANASKEVAHWLYDHAKMPRTRDFKEMLSSFLSAKFHERLLHDEKIVGSSNKSHKFANVIVLDSGKRLIVDPVANDPSSINARVVANLDVKAAANQNIIQRIVYDDEETWSPADLNLLQVGAPVIRFSRSPDAIGRLAARG
jgi:hypothetical protein